MPADTRVVVIDDHEGARTSLCALLEANGLNVSGHASAQDYLAGLPAGQGHCLVVDMRMPGMSGLELHLELMRRNLPVPVIIVTGHADVPLAVAAMKAGVQDFIEKPPDEDVLMACVRRALEASRSASVVAAEAEAARAMIGLLTERERQVMEHLVLGKSNKLVAGDLGISPRTVEIHRARIHEKLHARGLSDLVRLARVAELPLPRI